MKIITALFLLCSPCFGVDIAPALDAKLKESRIPIDGVSIKLPNDKATWRIDFKPEATPEQRAAAQQVLQDFDPATVTKPVTEGGTDWSIIALWIAVGALAVKVGLDPKVLRSESEAQASVDSKKV